MARKPRLLFVAMSESIHTARWLNQLEDEGWDLHLFPSIDQGIVHPELRVGRVHHSFYGDPAEWQAQVPQTGFYVRHHGIAWVIRRFLNLEKRGYRARQLARLIRRLQPDLVHSLELQAAGYLTLEAKRLLGGAFPRWLATNWGSDVSLFGRLAEHRGRIRQVLAACDHYGCECRRDLQLAREHGLRGDALPVTPNGGGFDLEQAARLRAPGPASQRRIIMVKGYQTWAGRALVALRALARCAELLKPYQVVVHSASEDVKIAAQLLAADHGVDVLVLPPFQPHEAILGYHGRARISIGLSIGDGISTSLLEALVMGAFPIQSDTACAGEWLEHGKTGFIVPPEDPDAVERALRAALADDRLVDAAMEANQATVRERLDQRALQPVALGMYRRILDSLPGPSAA